MSGSPPVSPLSDVTLTTGLVVAYVSTNRVAASELPMLIARCHEAITALASGRGVAPEAQTELQAQPDMPSAAQIRKSVRPDAIMSFIDGRHYKTLKRHLTAHGLHPQSYRARYGLPADYPMVAQDYAARRSALARSIGLGVSSGRAA